MRVRRLVRKWEELGVGAGEERISIKFGDRRKSLARAGERQTRVSELQKLPDCPGKSCPTPSRPTPSGLCMIQGVGLG
jgi:hypothetical protein